MGKKKVEMKLVGDKSKRHTTFTKRRQGLLRKAKKFFQDTDSAGAVIVFSQAGNCFAFGNPTVDTVLHRYVTATGNLPEAAAMTEAQWKIFEDLEKDGWNEKVKELGLEETSQLLAAMENFERELATAEAMENVERELATVEADDSPEVGCSVEESEKSAEDEETDEDLCEISEASSGIPLMPPPK